MYAAAYQESRTRRNAAIVFALDTGCPQDEVAHAAGITASAVRKIRDETRKDTNDMVTVTERDTAARENRLRRLAAKRGMALRKSRAREGNLIGTYGLVDLDTNSWAVHGGHGYGLDLDEVQAALAGDDEQ